MREEGCAAIGMLENVFNGLTSPDAIENGVGKELTKEIASAVANTLVAAERCGHEAEVARLTKERDLFERHRAELQDMVQKQTAHYYRLTEEREKWDIDVTMDGDDVIVTVNGEERFRASPEWLETNALYNAYHRLTEERDMLKTQSLLVEMRVMREDIRRLVGALEEADHTSLCSDDSTRTPTAKQGRGLCYRCTLLAELSAKYPKGVD